MKAAVRTAYGPPESVRITEIATPEPGPGEVLVRIRASAVNRTDVGYRAGRPRIVRVFAGLRRPKFQVIGTEFAGAVEAVGEGITSFAACKPILGPEGLFLATDVGTFPWNPLLALTTRVGRGPRVRFPLPTDDQDIVRYLRDRVQAAEFRPVIDRTYPLDDIVEAYRYVETGQKVGNVAISIG